MKCNLCHCKMFTDKCKENFTIEITAGQDDGSLVALHQVISYSVALSSISLATERAPPQETPLQTILLICIDVISIVVVC